MDLCANSATSLLSFLIFLKVLSNSVSRETRLSLPNSRKKKKNQYLCHKNKKEQDVKKMK